MTKQTVKPTIPVTTPMLPALERQARLCAGLMGISRAELVRRAVADYLDRLQTGTIPQAAQGVQNGG